MPYTSTTFRVAIASPSDVREERRVVREVIHNWNAAHSMSRGVVLLPVGWETDTTAMMGARAQAIINSQIIDTADLLIAIFWTRLGSPTGKAQSGTVEEIQEFLAAGKPVMLYFSAAPVQAGSVDPVQYAALMEFRRWAEGNGLIGTYDTVADLREMLSQQLALLVNTNPVFGQPTGNGSDIPVIVIEPEPANMLSPEALLLLDQITLDPGATLIVAEFIGGLAIQTNGRNFVPEGDPKAAALFRDAVSQLRSAEYIRSLGSKDQVFQPTHAGYAAADRLRKVTPPRASESNG